MSEIEIDRENCIEGGEMEFINIMFVKSLCVLGNERGGKNEVVSCY